MKRCRSLCVLAAIVLACSCSVELILIVILIIGAGQATPQILVAVGPSSRLRSASMACANEIYRRIALA